MLNLLSRHPLSQRARLFLRDENGLILTEFLILLPLLLWAFMALFIYWEAFRTINQAQKASYAVSDLMARQTQVDRAYISGMDDIIAYLMGMPVARVQVRVSSIEWDERNNRYDLMFSESPGNKMPRLTATTLNTASMRARIPTMAHRDSALLVETVVDYAPSLFVEDGSYQNVHGDTRWWLLRLQVPAQSFENFIVTRPRNRRVCLVETPCPETM